LFVIFYKTIVGVRYLKVFIYVLLFVFVSCLWKDKVEPIPAMNAQEYTHFTNYTNKSLQASSKDLKILSKKKVYKTKSY